jgi:hypothetical protein
MEQTVATSGSDHKFATDALNASLMLMSILGTSHQSKPYDVV